MCGRYGQWSRRERIEELLGIPPSEGEEIPPKYNITPGTYPWIARADDGQPGLYAYFWGLVPYWSKDPKKGVRPINARTDTVAEKPMFRKLIKERRCLIPADCYYEWKESPAGKQPHLFRMASGDPFFFAGLWDVWHDGAPDAIASFTILTTDPNEVAATVHNRMPVIVQAKDYERWLDPKIRDTEKIADILRPYPGGMVTYPISRRINSPKNEGAELIEPNEESGRGNAA